MTDGRHRAGHDAERGVRASRPSLGPDRAHHRRSARRFRAGDRRVAGVRSLYRSRHADHLGGRGHRLCRRMGGDARCQRPGAAPTGMCVRTWCCGCCRPQRSAGSRCSTAWWRSPSPSAWCGTAGTWWTPPCCSTSAVPLICSSRSGSTTRRCRSAAALMLIRYIWRGCSAIVFVFDPRIMTVGHAIEHEAPADLAHTVTDRAESADVDRRLPGDVLRPARGGHADLPGAGHLRGRAVLRLRPTDGRRGAEHDRPAQLHHADGVAAVCHGRGVHAAGRRGTGAGRSVGGVAGRHQGLARACCGGVVRPVRRDLRIVGGDRAGDGHDPVAGDAGARLSARLRAGRAGRVRDHRRGDPAVAGADPVRHRHRAIGAAAVPRGHSARAAAGRRFLRLGALVRAAQEFPRRAADAVPATAAHDVARAAGDGGAVRGAGGHLWRLHDDHRIGRARRGHRADRQRRRLSRASRSAHARGHRRGAAQRRRHHADHRDGAGVRPLDDGIRHPGATGRLRRTSRIRHLGVPADDQRAAADHRLLPGGGQRRCCW